MRQPLLGRNAIEAFVLRADDKMAIPAHLRPLVSSCSAAIGSVDCTINGPQVALTALTTAWAFVYFGLYFYYLALAVHKLSKLPRQDHKIHNMMARLQACQDFPLLHEMLSA